MYRSRHRSEMVTIHSEIRVTLFVANRCIFSRLASRISMANTPIASTTPPKMDWYPGGALNPCHSTTNPGTDAKMPEAARKALFVVSDLLRFLCKIHHYISLLRLIDI